jgi:hypothetical protein
MRERELAGEREVAAALLLWPRESNGNFCFCMRERETLLGAPRNEEACKTYWPTHAAALIAPRNEELEDGSAQETQPPCFLEPH